MSKSPLLHERSNSGSERDYSREHDCCSSSGDNCPGCQADERPTGGLSGDRNRKQRNQHTKTAGDSLMGGGVPLVGGLLVKGPKPRLKSLGSSASTDEVASSGFLSRGEISAIGMVARQSFE